MVWTDLESGTLSADQCEIMATGAKSETVIIQHIITRGTVDEKILKALTEKDKTQTALMSAVKAELEEQ